MMRFNGKPVREAEAVVHQVDSVCRELAAHVEGVPVTIYVPPDCEVVLRGERVKLRLVQPRDRLRLAYTERLDSLVARSIEIHPPYPTRFLPQ